MEFDDHEEEEVSLPASYDSPDNLSRGKMSTPGGGGDDAPTHVPQPQATASGRKARYRECLKNHAVGIGGHALDGCGEFMPAGAEGTLDGLRCAACNCHRNFHRKEADVGFGGGGGEIIYAHLHQPNFTPYYRPPAGYLHLAPQHQHHQYRPPLALPSTSGGGGTPHSRDELDDVSDPSGGGVMMAGSSKKRFRTKFSQDQKEKMLALAERLGWRIQKHDEAVVQQFCNETGVRRHVLKVWMHNNKHTLGKKP